MAERFATSKQNVSLHIENILKDKELAADSAVKDYLTTAADGKKYSIKLYSLEMTDFSTQTTPPDSSI